MDTSYNNTTLEDVIQDVQNPVIGSLLIWCFIRKYDEKNTGSGVIMPLTFLVLPITLDPFCRDQALSTNWTSGLRKFGSKLGTRRDAKLLLHERALKFRELTLQSLGFCATYGFLDLDYSSAVVYGKERKSPKLSKELDKYVKTAERLGVWCGSEQPAVVSRILGVEF